MRFRNNGNGGKKTSMSRSEEPVEGKGAGKKNPDRKNPDVPVSERFNWHSYESAGPNLAHPEVHVSAAQAQNGQLSEYQIAFLLQGAEQGVPLDVLCRKAGISDAVYLKWRRKYGGLLQSEYDRMRALEEEVQSLRRKVQELNGYRTSLKGDGSTRR